jgi:citrate synthase
MSKKKPATKKNQESMNTLTITDNRTGQTYEIPIENDTIRAIDLRQIKLDPNDFGMMTYDPAFTNTASCKSAITFIDGDKGILRHRGYPIEQLANQSTFLEVAYLLIHGELPRKEQLDYWTSRIMRHTYIHENLAQLIATFRYDAHPMGMLVSSIAAMSTFHQKARNIETDMASPRKTAHAGSVCLPAAHRPTFQLPG